MKYHYDNEHRLVCSTCYCHIESTIQDRHSCYWINLHKSPIGHVALVLSGQFDTYNSFEKRIARALWEEVKAKHKPKKIRKVRMFDSNNFEMYNVWVRLGDVIVR